MIHFDYKYIAYSFGGPNKRDVMDVKDFKTPDNGADHYRTYFRFTDDYLKYYERTKSVKGYSGKCYADFIPIDIDDEDLKNAWLKTKELISFLDFDYGFDVQHLFFSGSKGFHLYLPSVCFGTFIPSENLNDIFKSIVMDIAGEVADSVNYDKNRLFRLVNTKNSKSGLYKIPLTYSEFNNGIDSILELAKNKRSDSHPGISDNIKNDQFIELYQKYKIEEKQTIHSNGFLNKIANGVREGNRDNTAIKIVGTLRKAGHDKEFTKAILTGWNRGNTPPLDDSTINKCIQSGYSYGDPVEVEKDIKPIWAIGDEYAEYSKTTKKVNLGISFIDQKIRGLRPGQVLTIMGFTGNFKSGLLQWIMRHYQKHSKNPVLMFEMEMSNLDLFERAAQMTTGETGRVIEDKFKNNNSSEIIKSVRAEQENFLVVDRPGLSFDEMKVYFESAERVLKSKIELVGIDFLQLMQGSGNSGVQIIDSVAKGMKDFAKDMNTAVIALSQVTGVEDEFAKINLMDSRDSKTIGQMSDYVLGIRLNKEKEDRQIIDILKNRKGGKTKGEIDIDKKNLRFTEVGFVQSP